MSVYKNRCADCGEPVPARSHFRVGQQRLIFLCRTCQRPGLLRRVEGMDKIDCSPWARTTLHLAGVRADRLPKERRMAHQRITGEGGRWVAAEMRKREARAK